MRAYVRDRAPGRPRAESLQHVFCDANPPYHQQQDPFSAPVTCQEHDESSFFKHGDTLVLVHADATSWPPWIEAAKTWFPGQIVIVTSPGGRTMGDLGLAPDFPQAAKARIHACAWSLDNFRTAPRPPRLERWIHQVRHETADHVDWSLLHPLPPDPLYAVKMLCEAAQLASEGRYPELIRPPSDWLTPFGHDLDEAFKDVPTGQRTEIAAFLRQGVKSTDDIAAALVNAEKAIEILNA